MKTPIIFIHYDNTPYLKYTLKSAKYFNPNKEIILLGDGKNEKYTKYGIEHIPFIKYDQTKSIKTLNKDFIYISGSNRQTEQDKKFELFCFKRWLYLYEFMKENNLNSCWYFDSDTLILSDLKTKENKFKNYDITEQSNGSSMKGIIKFQQIKDFINTINQLFLDNNYLDIQKKDMAEHPNYTFCDMRAYKKFKEKYNPKAIKLNITINNETHDECICQTHGMETEYVDFLKKKIKKLYFKNSNIYEKIKKTGKLVKLNSINMSWVTISFIEKLYYYSRYGKFPPFYVPILNKMSRIPRFIKIKITKDVK